MHSLRRNVPALAVTFCGAPREAHTDMASKGAL